MCTFMFNMAFSRTSHLSRFQIDTKPPHALYLSSAACEGYLILFRTFVSQPSVGKGRAVLEGIGLAPETIEACYGSYPRKEEEAVQAGLIEWVEGHHDSSPTWRMLLTAMEYAGVAQHHCQGLRDKLYQRLMGVCVCVCVCVCMCVWLYDVWV